jgi:hypothetical protein
MSDLEDALPPLPTFGPEERVCGNCKLWSAHSVDGARGWVGPCRLNSERGHIPPSAPQCNKFVARGVSAPLPPDESRRARTLRSVGPQVIRRARDPNETLELEDAGQMTRAELMELFREAAGDVHAAPLANKWDGGTLRLIPANPELQPRDIPIDGLFHKVVMIRDRLRTLEAKLNGHPRLSDAEKVELQHYITRCYGSLTTFNVLFKEKGDQFVGEKSGD